MSTLFAILALLTLVFLLVGLINPKWLKDNKGHVFTRKQIAITCGILFLVFGAISGATSKSGTSTEAQATPIPTSSAKTTSIASPTPSSSPENQAIKQYASQMSTLVGQLETQNQVITYDANNLDSVGFNKFRTDAITAESTFKAIQQQLNAMNVPPEMTDVHAHFTTAISLYIQGLEEVVKGIDDNDTSEVTAGANVYKQGTDELNKATQASTDYLNSH